METDPKAREVLRAWVANGGLICALRPETWDDAANWGIVLADVARHIANAVQELHGEEASATLAEIQNVFNAELGEPTDTPTRYFEA